MSNHADIKMIRTRLLNEWDNTIPLTFSVDALKDKPDDIWVRFDVRPGDERQITIFPVTYEVVGRIYFKVIIPTGKRDGKARTLVDAFTRDWRDWRSDDYRVRCEGSDFAEGSDDDGSYLLVSIAYRSHQTVSEDDEEEPSTTSTLDFSNPNNAIFLPFA